MIESGSLFDKKILLRPENDLHGGLDAKEQGRHTLWSRLFARPIFLVVRYLRSSKFVSLSPKGWLVI